MMELYNQRQQDSLPLSLRLENEVTRKKKSKVGNLNQIPKTLALLEPRKIRRPNEKPPSIPNESQKFATVSRNPKLIYDNFDNSVSVPIVTIPRLEVHKTTSWCQDPTCTYNVPIPCGTVNNTELWNDKFVPSLPHHLTQDKRVAMTNQQLTNQPNQNVSQIPRPSSVPINNSRRGTTPTSSHGQTTMDIHIQHNSQRQRQIRPPDWLDSAGFNMEDDSLNGISNNVTGKTRAPITIPTGLSNPPNKATTNYTEISKRRSQGTSLSGSEESGIGFSASSNKSETLSVISSNHNSNSQPSSVSTNSRSLRAANAAATFLDPVNLYHQVIDPIHNPLCANCHGVIQIPDRISEPSLPLKADGSWNFNHQIHHPIQRNNSIGGFTLTGQDTRKLKKSRMSKFCSSHKIALVVSTFSFLVTIGLTITLILMKNKGMMEPM